MQESSMCVPLETGEIPMRYAPDHNEATRDRILEAASRLFREHGIEAVGLAKIMAEANLTVGTFYTHFKSKEALVREALLHSLQARYAELERALRVGDLEMAVGAYLSPEHRDAPGAGCPTAALASEVARHPRTTLRTFASQMAPSLDLVAACLSKRCGKKVSRADATAFFGLLVGTLQLARATPDRAASTAILEAGVRAALLLAK
jgi:TetR/AcrR family transcriptional repressor of nem operon